ncbi:ComF family protein [Algoriphagus hitonicola]|uniref:ComF family protein n=1 Tax=Algoriphagus hitonicola TaxID=435880 RepID=A0A1I2SHB9_9BACT|nr:ComF family protein [Algoriphagus hitonicola]SFG52174.1 comF family protein [Algoriphagus hitonicola]
MRLLLLKDFLDLIFPVNCPLCQTALYDWEDSLCTVCRGNLPISSHYLRPEDNDLTAKIEGLTRVTRAMAFLKFTKDGQSQQLLHLLKYRNRPDLGIALGKWFGQTLESQDYVKKWDMICPVPLHQMKKKRRGYNQSEEFAKGLAQSLNLPVENLLIRKVFTDTQTKKSRLERLENVSQVFDIQTGINISNKNILLVDDVITTGATLCSCANMLLANGAKNVDLATIAAGGRI